ncbi:MAG TPA: DUF58 domain-containing protein [Thermoanaerobaculia bacterium]|nr:DUF58 domain-containing protein [Thermoanaerobaculia bacterium]
MRAQPASPLFAAAAFAEIRDLHLVARAVVEGFLAGQHASRRLAVGVEFSQYRTYAQGDDPRGIDWRLHARTDRYFLREGASERDVLVRVVLDASASMAVPAAATAAAAGKFDTARIAAAALAYLAHLQGDAVALEVVGGAGARMPSPRSGDGITGMLHDLERLQPGGAWPEPAELLPRLLARRGRELVLVLSDCWERGAEMRAAFGALRALRHEVLVLRVLAPQEIELPPGGEALFEDAETGERVAFGGGASREAYAARFAAHREALRRDLLALGVAFAELRTDEPLAAALRSFLLRRRLLP